MLYFVRTMQERKRKNSLEEIPSSKINKSLSILLSIFDKIQFDCANKAKRKMGGLKKSSSYCRKLINARVVLANSV